MDKFDNASGKPVWHGWAENTVTQSDRSDQNSIVVAGVAVLFESFPG